MQCGVDVGATRTDDLDRSALAEVVQLLATNQHPVSILELGCASGGQSRRFAHAGATVVAVDRDYQAIIVPDTEIDKSKLETVTFIQSDIRDYCYSLSRDFTLCHFQRTLHYLTYAEAVALLTVLQKCITHKLYLSATGINTAIGEHYCAALYPIHERFSYLTPTGQELFFITAPVCLYTHVELHILLSSTGWEIEKSWVSAFGNHKMIARPR